MTIATWIAIAIAGPGALLVLGWFLRDVARMRRRPPTDSEPSDRR